MPFEFNRLYPQNLASPTLGNLLLGMTGPYAYGQSPASDGNDVLGASIASITGLEPSKTDPAPARRTPLTNSPASAPAAQTQPQAAFPGQFPFELFAPNSAAPTASGAGGGGDFLGYPMGGGSSASGGAPGASGGAPGASGGAGSYAGWGAANAGIGALGNLLGMEPTDDYGSVGGTPLYGPGSYAQAGAQTIGPAFGPWGMIPMAAETFGPYADQKIRDTLPAPLGNVATLGVTGHHGLISTIKDLFF